MSRKVDTWEGDPRLLQGASRVDMTKCGCGCGNAALLGREAEAAALAAGRRLTNTLQIMRRAGGRKEQVADELLWAWGRGEKDLEDFVHLEVPTRKPPTASWMAAWREQVAEL